LAIWELLELVIAGLLELAILRYTIAQPEINGMDRDLELRVKGHLYEIATVNDEVLESKQGFPMAEEGYRKTLESVGECAAPDLVDEVAENIKEHIRNEKERPDNQSVRRDARFLLVNQGILPDTYLNRA
jgi:hypothetical protein